MNRTVSRIALAILTLILSMGLAVGAPITTYNTNALQGNGVHAGSGIPDGNFTAAADGGIFLSLRLDERFVGPISPTGNDYTCSAGMQCNFLWEVAATTPIITAGAYNINIFDVTTGLSINFDPTLIILGGSYWDPNLGGETATYNPTATGNQNSEYLGFPFLSTPLGGWNPTDRMVITLSATPTNTNVSPFSTEITVNGGTGVPEPMSFVLMGAGLVGIVFLRRRNG